MPDNLAQILEQLGIQEWEEPIFEMSYTELREHFGYQSDGLNETRLLRNLIWQDRQMVLSGELQRRFGNIRSYWYSRAKPVLSRANSPEFNEKYDAMIDTFGELIKDYRLLNYGDFGFLDDNQLSRKIGGDNIHIFCVAEKTGHMHILEQLHNDYDITVVALGGQPSILSSEYLLTELVERGFRLDQTVPLFSIVDYDPWGDSIVRSFINQTSILGFEGEYIRIDLIHPSRMTQQQIELNKFRLGRGTTVDEWLAETHGLENFGVEGRFGLEADSMTWNEITQAFHDEVVPYLQVPKDVVVRHRLQRDLIDVTKERLLLRILGW